MKSNPQNKIYSPRGRIKGPLADKAPSVSCAPGERIDKRLLQQLSQINERRARRKDLDFPSYVKALKILFQLEEKIGERKKGFPIFLAGFFLGEGSLNVSAKKTKGGRFGIMLDPEFSLTQHINGVLHLVDALEYFKTGTIRYKSASNATLIFRIDSRKSLLEKCIPFCEEFCLPHAGENWKKRFYLFKNFLNLFTLGEHREEKGFIHKILPLWDALRNQRNQRNSSFQSLAEAQEYARDQCKK